MDTDPKQEDDFHKMDGSADPYAEDPCVVMVRDWPPLFAVHLQYQSTGEYLSVKKGVLVLTKNPADKWKFLATPEGYVIRNLKRSLDVRCQAAGKLSLSGSKAEAVGEWRVRPTADNGQVRLSINSTHWRSPLTFDEKNPAKVVPGEMSLLKDGDAVPLWIVEQPQDLDLLQYACPSCKQGGLHEDQLWYHWAHVHGRDPPDLQSCPICTTLYGDSSLMGDMSWGYGNHLFHSHGPPSRKAVQPGVSRKHPTYGFSLVIIQHPTTKKFVLIEEGAQAGWWLPAGGVDPGEGFKQAAIREAKEEAGIDVVLKGILSFENSARPKGGGRQRMVFLAEPKNPDEPLKSIPDYESLRAVWITFERMVKDIKKSKKKLRGSEPLKWFKYVEEGGTVYPLSILEEEMHI